MIEETLFTATRGSKLNRAVALVHFTDENVAVAHPGTGERWSTSMKFFISAPFMIVGLSSAVQDQPIMPTVVDLPLVPATPTPKAGLNSWARSLARVMTAAPIRRAAWTSGTVSSTAAEVTKI